MTERFSDAVATFQHAMQRARQMVVLFEALSALRPQEPANDDALRSAYFQAVSSFDFFAHELAAIEARYRLKYGIRTRNICLPMDIMTIPDEVMRIDAAEARVRETNSYKAFVDPAKLSEMLSCYCSNPWDRIADRINEAAAPGASTSPGYLKGRLKSIWKRRNKIAHEADIRLR